jgi:hypothetical protein
LVFVDQLSRRGTEKAGWSEAIIAHRPRFQIVDPLLGGLPFGVCKNEARAVFPFVLFRIRNWRLRRLISARVMSVILSTVRGYG